MPDEEFDLTDDHLKLLRRMHVGWCEDEFGAPEIDPKRPYGNSSVIRDICEIIIEEDPGDRDFSSWELSHYTRLHEETQTALQIVLTVGYFRPGFYVRENYRWKWAEGQSNSDGNGGNDFRRD